MDYDVYNVWCLNLDFLDGMMNMMAYASSGPSFHPAHQGSDDPANPDPTFFPRKSLLLF
jgi:hypothetical protein